MFIWTDGRLFWSTSLGGKEIDFKMISDNCIILKRNQIERTLTYAQSTIWKADSLLYMLLKILHFSFPNIFHLIFIM